MSADVEVFMEFFFQIGPMELAGSYNWKPVLTESDNEKNRTLNASDIAASPHWAKNRLMCSLVVVLSWPWRNPEPKDTARVRILPDTASAIGCCLGIMPNWSLSTLAMREDQKSSLTGMCSSTRWYLLGARSPYFCCQSISSRTIDWRWCSGSAW